MVRPFRTLFWIGYGLVVAALASHGQERVQPLVGAPTTVTVRKGDTLFKIARRHDVGLETLRRLNHLTCTRVKSGQTLQLPTWYILPRNPSEGIVLNIPERGVYVFRDGKFVARHEVAVGKASTQTATGDYFLREKKTDPTWRPPRSIVEKEGIKDEPVPAGPANPLGDRWMGWSKPGYGFHSTNAPHSVGNAVSHGCVRLYPEHAREMFTQVSVGMPIYALYEPIKIGAQDGRYYLSVSPDLYHTGDGSVEQVLSRLDALGLRPLVDETTVRDIVAEADDSPHLIAGEDERIEANGAAVKTPVAPVQAAGHWVVPARAVLQALGGQVIPQADGHFELRLGTRTLTVKPGDSEVQASGQSLKTDAPITVVEDTLMVPLRLLLDSLDLNLQVKDHTLQLSTRPPEASGVGR